MSSLLQKRESIKQRISANPSVDRGLHLYVTATLVLNVILILYTMLVIIFRFTLQGNSLIDSLPIAFYAVPFLVFLPILILSYYRQRSGLFNLFILLASSIIFGLISNLVHGFLLFLIINTSAAVIMLLMGRFKPEGRVRELGKKGIAWLVFLNLVGLAFPVSILVMGQTPIASATYSSSIGITVEAQLADFDYDLDTLHPTQQVITSLESNGFSLSLRVLENDSASWDLLEQWLVALNSSNLVYQVVLVSDRAELRQDNTSLGTSQLLEDVYASHIDALDSLSGILANNNITQTPKIVLFDMTLSFAEWMLLMANMRSVSLSGFSDLVRRSLDSIDSSLLTSMAQILKSDSETQGLPAGVVLESYVLDDAGDSDTGIMKTCGQTVETLALWDEVSILTSRSLFSLEMEGDVGEYLVHSFSNTVATRDFASSMIIGTCGDGLTIDGRQNSVYQTLAMIIDDIVIAASQNVNVTLRSIQTLIDGFGASVFDDLVTSLLESSAVNITYTFRIYAFRIVIMAVDSFDLLYL